MVRNITFNIDTLDHDILDHHVIDHHNDDLLLIGFNGVNKASPYLLPLVYGIVNLCFFPLMAVIFDNFKIVSDRWRIKIDTFFIAHLLFVIGLLCFDVAGIIVIIVYSLSDGLVTCTSNRPPPFGLSEKFPFLRYFGTIMLHHFICMIFFISTAAGVFDSYIDLYDVAIIIHSVRSISRTISSNTYYANKEWRSSHVCLINNVLAIPAIEIAALVALYIYFGPVALGELVFIGLDAEVSIAFHRQYQKIVANEKAEMKVGETQYDEEEVENNVLVDNN